MKNTKVAAVSLNQTPLDWEHNYNNIVAAIQEAKDNQVSILCCPELCVTGYGCEDMFLSPATQTMALNFLQDLIPKTENIIVSVGLPIFYKGSLYNVAALLSDRKCLGFTAKQNLAFGGVYYENRWFRPWPEGIVETFCAEGFMKGAFFPIGDLIFNFDEFRLGYEICEDAWVEKRVGYSLAERGVDIILNPSASHFAIGKSNIRKHFVLSGAKLFNVVYIYANLLGNEAGRILYDGDTLIAVNDKLIAEGERFSFQDRTITTAIVNIKNNKYNESDPLQNDKNQNTWGQNKFPWEKSLYIREEEFSRATALGLFDYLRKSHAQGFVLNLSGGADSAACACLVYLMVQLGVQSLGKEKFEKKLNISPENSKSILSSILNCLYQKTKNNSNNTLEAAVSFAASLGISFTHFSVDTFIEEYCKTIESIVGRTLNWDKDDMALQNIQARVRSPSAWVLANIKNFIFLSTSNRSELSVGYATMDGDASGGLNPIAGIDKSFIRSWLKWLETEGVLGVGSIPGLKAINTLPPSAELRPLNTQDVEVSQTDETDLMPYQWLDTIERFFVRDKQSPLQILLILNKKYPKENVEIFAKYIDKFFKLWASSQWKRERMAPAFHVDDQSIDPKTWCRFPILSGGFKKELEDMWKYVSDN